MNRTLYLHIGIHKTGTSAIQIVCMKNHDELLRAGILFPKAGFTRKPAAEETATSGHRGLLGFMKEPAKLAHSVGRALLDEIEASACDRIVISSEVFSAPHNRGAVEGVSWFRQQGFNVKLIAYLRRQDIWLDSFYRERLKWVGKKYRETRSIEGFWREEGHDWLNYKSRMGVWVEAVARGNAVIRSYEDIQTTGGVVADFLKIIGADECPNMSGSGEAQNPSLPRSAADLVRAFNASSAFGMTCKRELLSAVQQMDLFRYSAGSLVSPELWKELESNFGEQNEELRSDWLSGLSESLSFYADLPRESFSEQAISYEDSKLLIGGLLGRPTQWVYGEAPETPDLRHRDG